MRNKGKKILGLALATMLVGSTFSLVGCGGTSYKGDKLTAGYDSAAAVQSNGGFVVEKGEYVYFINGSETYTASNKYGSVVKGALLRVSKSDLNGYMAGEDVTVETVVPSLFVTQNYTSGIFIYGDYVYYATPTTDKNQKGEVENTWLDFKRAKLDGTEAPMKGQFFRLSSNSANYRYVTVDGVDENSDGEDDVFCMYEENSQLKSYNTATNKTTVLVSGAKSSFFYNDKDLTDPNAYYTMSVVIDADKENKRTASYDQIYSVNAAAKVESYTVADGKASYTVKGGKTYTFDESYFKDNDLDAKDYTDYPYVNLGSLVVDGIGYSSENEWTQFNDAADQEKTPVEFRGYTYTLKRYQNGGLYYTRTALTKAGDSTDTKLYYIPHDRGENWSAVAANEDGKSDIVLLDASKSQYDSAIYDVANGEGVRSHRYYYVSGSNIVRADAAANGEATEVTMTEKATSPTLWQIRGEYLYFYSSGTNGNNVSRINVTGSQFDYDWKAGEKEYQITTIDYIDWNSSWYKPEFVGDLLLYSNAQSYGGSTAYNYIYAAKLGTTEELLAANEKYEAYGDYLDEYSSDADTQALIKYFFATDGTLSQEVIDEYDPDIYAQVTGKFTGENKLSKQSAFNRFLGKMKTEDEEAIENDWANSLLQPEEEEEEESGLPTWAVWTIAAVCLVVVAAAVAVPAVIITKKKKAAERKANETANAYKRKRIDMTKDETVDVYADETETPSDAAQE